MSNILVAPDARKFLLDQSPAIRAHLIDVIREKAQHADTQMVVISWTLDGCWPHIERAIKDYAYRPGIRCLFHKTHEGITIDKIDWRCNDPYGDGK
jgi:hypothetical protein